MGFLPQIVIWFHKIQYRIVSTYKSIMSYIWQEVRIQKGWFTFSSVLPELSGSDHGCDHCHWFVFSVEAQTHCTSMLTDPSLSVWSVLWAWRRGHKLSPKSNLCKSICGSQSLPFFMIICLVWYAAPQLLSFCIRQMYYVRKKHNTVYSALISPILHNFSFDLSA